MRGYRLTVRLKNSSKPIYRVVELPGKLSFHDLHFIIQEIFGFENIFEYMFNLDLNDNNEVLESKLVNKMVFEYSYGFDYCWNFEINVMQLDDFDDIPKVIDFKGDNLCEDYSGVKEFEKLCDENNLDRFDVNFLNNILLRYQIEDVINNNEIKYDYIDVISEIKDLIDCRNFEGCLKYKINSNATIYWVIIKTIEGYVIEMFDDYDEMLEGFYNLYVGEINRAFGHFYTFILNNEKTEIADALDNDGKILAFYNEPGFIPSLIETEVSEDILNWLKDLAVALKNDSNISEVDEIIEINIKDFKFIDSNIYVHEPKVNINDFDNGYRGNEKIISSLTSNERTCLDIVTLPSLETCTTGELQIYAVIASESDYIIREVFLPDKNLMMETLIDIMIEFFNHNGVVKEITVNNLNIYFMIYSFLMDNGIKINEENIDLEISMAVADAFGINDEIDDISLNELFEEFEDKEVEIRLDDNLDKKELLN